MRPNLTASQAESPADKLRLALELFDDGVAMMRLRLVRDFGEQAGEARLEAWLRGSTDEVVAPRKRIGARTGDRDVT
jgi:hypothetical protein